MDRSQSNALINYQHLKQFHKKTSAWVICQFIWLLTICTTLKLFTNLISSINVCLFLVLFVWDAPIISQSTFFDSSRIYSDKLCCLLNRIFSVTVKLKFTEIFLSVSNTLLENFGCGNNIMICLPTSKPIKHTWSCTWGFGGRGRRVAVAKTSQRTRLVSPDPYLSACIKYVSWWRIRTNFRPLTPLGSSPCLFEKLLYGYANSAIISWKPGTKCTIKSLTEYQW